MAQFVELDIDQGTDFSFNIDVTGDDGSPTNVTSYVFTSSIKKSYYSSSPTANLTVTIANSANGNVVFSLNAATTSNIKAGRYLIDVKQKDAANLKTRLMEGVITVNPQVTK
jgi:hypothetical protein